MEKEEDKEYYVSEIKLVSAPKKKFFKIEVPYILRFAIVWTAFFAIIGILIQSFQEKAFVFLNFFGANYLDWIKSFGTFTDITIYGSSLDIISALFGKWYYFFYTGGLLALLWGLLSWLVNWELMFKKREKKEEKEKPEKEAEERKIEVKKPEEKKPEPMPAVSVIEVPEKNIVDRLLEEGQKFLAAENMKEAETIYNKIRQEYNPAKDPEQKLYNKIRDFYEQILKHRK